MDTHGEQGDAVIQFYLGEMWRNGLGVPQDYKTASKFYRLAYEQGYADAQSIFWCVVQHRTRCSKGLQECGQVVQTCCRTGECPIPENSGSKVCQLKMCSTEFGKCSYVGKTAATNGNKKGGEMRGFVEIK
tara:strand:+ start:1072 stop:1464 length:393 start_codon:yes stop_codon:yes gene_type:complete